MRSQPGLLPVDVVADGGVGLGIVVDRPVHVELLADGPLFLGELLELVDDSE